MKRDLKVILDEKDAKLLEELQELTGNKRASYTIREIIRNYNRLIKHRDSLLRENEMLQHDIREIRMRVGEFLNGLSALKDITSSKKKP